MNVASEAIVANHRVHGETPGGSEVAIDIYACLVLRMLSFSLSVADSHHKRSTIDASL